MKRVCAFPAAQQELITAPSFALFGQQTILFVCQPFNSRCFSIACRYEFSFAVARESNTMAVPKAFKLLWAIQILNHNHVLVAIPRELEVRTFRSVPTAKPFVRWFG
jgi:hypothetical protein